MSSSLSNINESTYTNYENFFTQPADLSASMHLIDNDLPTQVHYFNTIPTELPSTQTHQISYAMPTQTQVATTHNDTNLNGGCGTKTSTGSIYTSIPFVQIHTTDVQPQGSNFGNIFRRSACNQDEIKSEPIKSEHADAMKERTNTTPTPSERSSNRANDQRQQRDDTAAKNATTNDDMQASIMAQPFPAIHKCSQCAFISLSETRLTEHAKSTHEGELFNSQLPLRVPITCPGCTNIFYAHTALETHLQLDHLLTIEECDKLMHAIRAANPESNTTTKQCSKNNATCQDMQQRKSRIYLKNVECLREPCREPIEQQTNQITENYFQNSAYENNDYNLLECNATTTDDCNDYHALSNNDNVAHEHNSNNNKNIIEQTKGKPRKQKISIKSVDVLREPMLLRRDYEMQSLNNFINIADDIQLLNNNNTEQTNYINSTEGACNGVENSDKPRRPKIYIKNVDILKEPSNNNAMNATNMPETNNAMNFNFMPQTQSVNFDILPTSPAQVFDASLALLPMGSISEQYLFDNVSNNFLTNINDADSFSFVNTPNTVSNSNNNNSNSNNFVLDNTHYVSALDCGLESSHSSTTPIITEPTPPPPLQSASLPCNVDNIFHTLPDAATTVAQTLQQQQKQKIFIKNVDILKEPHLQHEQRGTLHLRTVDELNLMNKNEVENLITPHLDASQTVGVLAAHACEQYNNLLDCVNFSDAETYQHVENLKLQDFVDEAHMVGHNWTDDYDLGDDIDCIITDNITHTNAKLHDLDTPQVSLISIRDIEELTGGVNESVSQQEYSNNASVSTQQQVAEDFVVLPSIEAAEKVDEMRTFDSCKVSAQNSACQSPQLDEDVLKQERATKANTALSAEVQVNNVETITTTTTTATSYFNDVPPLVPVTNTIQNAPTAEKLVAPSNEIPLPPLVQINTGNINRTTASIPRIYVANNLLQSAVEKPDDAAVLEKPAAVTYTCGTSLRGRPFGSNRTGITKRRKVHGKAAELEIGMKCDFQNCAFRFKKLETLEYHKRCHNAATTPPGMSCPECNSNASTNWNSLHTHLWRNHKIDMELYSCELCSFKTPIYSRLLNTHAKIHSDVRNYKCEQCDKAFKNSKQLKNHRRRHRSPKSSTAERNSAEKLTHRCNDCNAVYSHQKTLREHSCKHSQTAKLQCELCGRVVASKSSLKLHMLTHEATKRFKCNLCQYTTNDHNAFRRHKMVHENVKMYICPHCKYKSIQSISFQKHVLQNHPEQADAIIYKCKQCTYSTINRAMFTMHQARHESPTITTIQAAQDDVNETCDASVFVQPETDTVLALDMPSPQISKIKVKSNLLLTDAVAISTNFLNTTNLRLSQLEFKKAVT